MPAGGEQEHHDKAGNAPRGKADLQTEAAQAPDDQQWHQEGAKHDEGRGHDRVSGVSY
jgi:hypothetical protein